MNQRDEKCMDEPDLVRGVVPLATQEASSQFVVGRPYDESYDEREGWADLDGCGVVREWEAEHSGVVEVERGVGVPGGTVVRGYGGTVVQWYGEG